MRDLWTGSVIAALIVGVLVWGLIVWSVVRHRKRGDELPRQTAYNLPLEIVYTILPFLIIAVLFFFTVVVQDKVKKRQRDPDETVAVRAFKWNWQFIYPRRQGPATAQPGQHGRHEQRDPDPGAADRPDDPVRAVLGRRHPLVLGAGVPLQARRHPGQRERPQQRLRGDRPREGGLRRPLRRAVRHLPRLHELRGPRGVRRRTTTPTSRRARPGMSTAEALENDRPAGRGDHDQPFDAAADGSALGQTTGG